LPTEGKAVQTEDIRNVAIIAHVDHGKTTLVDQMLYQSGMFRTEELDQLAGGRLGLIFDSNPIERERGITILSKNCSIYYTPRRIAEETSPQSHEQSAAPRRFKINIIDTPGHADFGGEVERVLKMAEGALLLVDAFEGPMPQTRFVLQKALAYGLKAIIVINKVDRPDSRPREVANEVFDLLIELGADDAALDFPVIYASARDGWASTDPDQRQTRNLEALFDAIVDHVPPPEVRPEEPLQILVTNVDYSDYVGRIAIGKVEAGEISRNQQVAVIARDGSMGERRVLQLFNFEGLGRKEAESVRPGEICAVVGLDPVEIGDTITHPEQPRRLKPIPVDEPTLNMMFRINDGPFVGRDGDYVTSRQLKERLERELRSNVALRAEPGQTSEEFLVSGRGPMHLGILLENMRREGYEVCAGKPKIIPRTIGGRTHEPMELLVITCPTECQSAVMSVVVTRRAEALKMGLMAGAIGFVHMEFRIPARGLIGLNARLLNATQGRAIMHHTFLEYAPMQGEIPRRQNGVMIASETGAVTSYALDALYDRGVFFVKTGDPIYEGQIVGEHCKSGDIVVNAAKAKHLSNVRSSTKETGAKVRPMREMVLEAALEYIEDDELVEITPKCIRLRKRLLRKGDRKKADAAILGMK